MSLQNKALINLKYFNWIHEYYGDIKKRPFAKINSEEFQEIPYNLNISANYEFWFPLSNICFTLGHTIPVHTKETLKKFTKKGVNKILGSIDRQILEKNLESSMFICLRIWTILISILNDLYALYINLNKTLSDREFILLDFWFDSLPVIDELILVYENLTFFHDVKKLKLTFNIQPGHLTKVFRYDVFHVHLLEPTEENLESLHCETWNKQDFVNHIYKQFAKIDVNLFNEWLIYKKIENIYETKEAFVYEYLTNHTNGLHSLSASTLKLLAINPIMDLDHVRKLSEERDLYHLKRSEALGPRTPREIFSEIFQAIGPQTK